MAKSFDLSRVRMGVYRDILSPLFEWLEDTRERVTFHESNRLAEAGRRFMEATVSLNKEVRKSIMWVMSS